MRKRKAASRGDLKAKKASGGGGRSIRSKRSRREKSRDKDRGRDSSRKVTNFYLWRGQQVNG